MTSQIIRRNFGEGLVEGSLCEVKEEGERGQLEKVRHRPKLKARTDKNDEFVALEWGVRGGS